MNNDEEEGIEKVAEVLSSFPQLNKWWGKEQDREKLLGILAREGSTQEIIESFLRMCAEREIEEESNKILKESQQRSDPDRVILEEQMQEILQEFREETSIRREKFIARLGPSFERMETMKNPDLKKAQMLGIERAIKEYDRHAKEMWGRLQNMAKRSLRPPK